MSVDFASAGTGAKGGRPRKQAWCGHNLTGPKAAGRTVTREQRDEFAAGHKAVAAGIGGDPEAATKLAQDPERRRIGPKSASQRPSYPHSRCADIPLYSIYVAAARLQFQDTE
jgi:hypothetical protein